MAAVLYIERERLRDKFWYEPIDGDRRKVELETEIDEPDPELHRLLPIGKDHWGRR